MQTTQTCGNTYFELSNHLGNVLAVVTDRKIAQPDGGGGISYYLPDVVSARDYYPGVYPEWSLRNIGSMQMSERSFCEDAYRYGFNGMEKDSEGMGGGGSTYDYGFRIYNAQIAKFLSVDPLFKSYPWYTSYQFAGNTPIQALDIDGLEILDYRSSYRISITISKQNYLNKPIINAIARNDGSFTPEYFRSESIAMNDISLHTPPNFTQDIIYDADRAAINTALGQPKHRGANSANKYIIYNDNYSPAKYNALAFVIDKAARTLYNFSQEKRTDAYTDYENMINAAKRAYDIVSKDFAKTEEALPGALKSYTESLGVSVERFQQDVTQAVMDYTYTNPFDKNKDKDRYNAYHKAVTVLANKMIKDYKLNDKIKKKSNPS